MLPLGVLVVLVTGARDQVVPGVLAESFAARPAQAGDEVRSREVAGAGHYELVNPGSAAWSAVQAAVREALAPAAGSEGSGAQDEHAPPGRPQRR